MTRKGLGPEEEEEEGVGVTWRKSRAARIVRTNAVTSSVRAPSGQRGGGGSSGTKPQQDTISGNTKKDAFNTFNVYCHLVYITKMNLELNNSSE